MPKTKRPRTKRPRTKKIDIKSWYKKCKICGTVVVAPNYAIGMWLHFKKYHPELNKSPLPAMPPLGDSQASAPSGQKPQRKRVPRKPRKNLRKPMRKSQYVSILCYVYVIIFQKLKEIIGIELGNSFAGNLSGYLKYVLIVGGLIIKKVEKKCLFESSPKYIE